LSFIRKFKKNGRIYEARVRSQRVDGKVKQVVEEYLGKKEISNDSDESVFPQASQPHIFDSLKVYGSVIAMDSLARKLGMYELLGEHASAILTLVYSHCHNYRSVSDTVKWFKKTDLSHIFGISQISEKQLRTALEGLENLDHFALQKSIFEMASKLCDEKTNSVIYDCTNIHFEGIHCKLAKYGKDKKNVKGRPLVQIGLAVTKKLGIPIFHQIHPGNVHDSKIFREAILMLRRYSIRGGTIVHDRGITSASSVLGLAEGRWSLIAGVSLHKGIKNAISNLDYSRMEVFKNHIIQGHTLFYGTHVPFELGSKKGKLLVLLNPARREAQRRKRLLEIHEARKALNQDQPIKPSLEKLFSKSKKINTHALNRAEKYDGISTLFIRGKISKETSVHLYFEKDIIERSFQALRGFVKIRPVHFRLNGKVSAHILICYLTYALLTTFRCFLYKGKGKEQFSEISALEAFEQLTSVYKLYYEKDTSSHKNNLENGPNYQIVTMTELQTRILKAVCPEIKM
jgi:transposase